VTKFLHKMFRI